MFLKLINLIKKHIEKLKCFWACTNKIVLFKKKSYKLFLISKSNYYIELLILNKICEVPPYHFIIIKLYTKKEKGLIIYKKNKELIILNKKEKGLIIFNKIKIYTIDILLNIENLFLYNAKIDYEFEYIIYKYLDEIYIANICDLLKINDYINFDRPLYFNLNLKLQIINLNQIEIDYELLFKGCWINNKEELIQYIYINLLKILETISGMNIPTIKIIKINYFKTKKIKEKKSRNSKLRNIKFT